MSCVRLFHLRSLQCVIEQGIIDQLYTLIRDQDPIVVTNALLALEEILQDEGGIVVNKAIATHLINNITQYTESGRAIVLELLLNKYKPGTDEETFAVLNIIDMHLANRNSSAVIMSTLEMFQTYLTHHEHIFPDVLMRCKEHLLLHLRSSNPEITYLILERLCEIIAKYPGEFENSRQVFYYRHSDPTCVKTKKIEILVLLADEENAEEILSELATYSCDKELAVGKYAIHCVGSLAKRPEFSEVATDKLVQLLHLGRNMLTSSALQVFVTFQFCELSKRVLDEILSVLTSTLYCELDDAGKDAFLWIIGEYGSERSDTVPVLDTIIVQQLEGNVLNTQLLITSVKVFVENPAQMQQVFGNVLQACTNQESDMDLSECALLYYNILKQDPEELRNYLKYST